MVDVIRTIEWRDDKVIMLDQRRLPLQEVYNTYEDYKGVANAIRDMVIRGAPAIGVAAAMGIALGGLGTAVKTYDEFYKRISRICETMAQTRPTAINLFWAIERMKAVLLLNKELPVKQLQQVLKEEAIKIYKQDIESNKAIGRYGQELFSDGDSVLTHCNAGALATAGYGTALGVLYAAQDADKTLKIYADETRPFLQGARLTAWELQKHGMDVTVICDNMAGWLMQKHLIKKVIVGADRIAANGDVANKIGTYSLAVLAQKHDIPFYIAAPTSTIDLNVPDGSKIPIEERNKKEVTHIQDNQITPDYVKILNPAFDVTPSEFITAIVTEHGVARAPYNDSLKAIMEKRHG